MLDSYLKQEKVRFRELFAQFDRDRSGHLDGRELRRLMQALMPHVTESQLEYFQVRTHTAWWPAAVLRGCRPLAPCVRISDAGTSCVPSWSPSTQSMLDLGGDVDLTPEEFLNAAKQCMGVEADVQNQELPQDVLKHLKQLSLAVAKDKVRPPPCQRPHSRLRRAGRSTLRQG